MNGVFFFGFFTAKGHHPELPYIYTVGSGLDNFAHLFTYHTCTLPTLYYADEGGGSLLKLSTGSLCIYIYYVVY